MALKRSASGSITVDDTGARVFRPLFVRVLSVVVWVLLVVFEALSWRNGAGAGLRAVPILLLVAVLVYALFWRPRVRVDEDAVTLMNVLRDIRVPFRALDAVSTQFALTLHSEQHKYAAWAAPAPGRTSVMGLARRDATGLQHLGVNIDEGMSASAAPNTDSGGAALLVQHRWERWRSQEPAAQRRGAGDPVDHVTVRWDVPVVVLLAVTLVGSVLALLV
ncbi:MAG TPA: PH domain-containing protein [Actinomycetales bacterium]|nr:PH domain-containing protein [Actinomycetales bacterium]